MRIETIKCKVGGKEIVTTKMHGEDKTFWFELSDFVPGMDITIESVGAENLYFIFTDDDGKQRHGYLKL